jgi:hypothetical protein
MARKPDGKPASVDRVSFTRPAAERIGKAVRQVEAGNRDLGPIEWGPRGGGAASKVFRVCTFTGAWAINTSKTVTFRNVTSTPNTASAMNLFCDLPASGNPCAIAKAGAEWYLVQSQFTSVTVISSVAIVGSNLRFATAKVNVIPTGSGSSFIDIPLESC